MTITPEQLDYALRRRNLEDNLARALNGKNNAYASFQQALKALADFLGMEVCGECIIEKKAEEKL